MAYPSEEAEGGCELVPVWEETAVSRETVQAMLDVTRAAMAKLEAPLMWMRKVMSVPGPVYFPSAELTTLLVTICLSSSARGPAWSYLQHGLSMCSICPMLTLALLTARVIPIRHQRPELYQIYLEVTGRYVWNIATSKPPGFREKCVQLVDELLQLSEMGITSVADFGSCMLRFLLCLVKRLTDATAEDWNSPPAVWNDNQNMSAMNGQISHRVIDMDDDDPQERFRITKANSLQALELVAKIMQNKRTASLLRIARRILPDQWEVFAENLSALDMIGRNRRSSTPKEAPEALGNLAAAIQRSVDGEWRTTHLPVIQALVHGGSQSAAFGNRGGLGCANPWLPLDIYLESLMERGRLHVKSPSVNIADMMKTLQAVQRAAWHEVFLGTWMAALRLVQRDRNWIDGPSPRISSRMCLLLTHVPLACVALVEEEEKCLSSKCDDGQDGLHSSNEIGAGIQKPLAGDRRAAVILSLQILGQFDALLVPPNIAVSAANQAAASISAKLNASGMSIDPRGMATPAGNLRHLVVDACISRGLLDTSAYLWLNQTGSGGSILAPAPSQSSPWTVFMEGAPLSASLLATLIETPAGSLAEVDKVYQIAMKGPVEDRTAAAKILCGASLTRSWNVQEHTIQRAVWLLSPPVGPEHFGPGSHLISHGPVLFVALDSMTPDDILHMLALHGMYPELAASLLPICEVFGSLPPALSQAGTDVYTIFSFAFLLLTRLWQFQRVPMEHSVVANGGLAHEANVHLEYLLQIRKMQTSSGGHVEKATKSLPTDSIQSRRLAAPSPSYSRPVSSMNVPLLSASTPLSQNLTLDLFPKVKSWYTQHKAGITSPLSALVRESQVQQVADRLLKLMFTKFPKASSSSSSSPGPSSGAEEKPALLAWDVIAAVPIVVNDVLTACSHGNLNPRDLITGLRNLIDFLPATIASFVTCCGAETYRGLYKPASMNGKEWPSPGPNLITVEKEIRDVLANTGVNVPQLITGVPGGTTHTSLPLPLAALISLTITFKLSERYTEMLLSFAGPALLAAASAGPWPSSAVVAALWCQKSRDWLDFIIFHVARGVFTQNRGAILQLLRSCFAESLQVAPSTTPKLTGHGGVGELLGHGRWMPTAQGLASVSPGYVYLRAFPGLHEIMFVSDEILALVADATRDIAVKGLLERDSEATTPTSNLGCSHPSLSTAIARASLASTVGASFLTVSGGAAMVRKLYLESIPTWLLTQFRTEDARYESSGTLLEGYAMARFVLLSGALVWGTSTKTEPLFFQYGAASGPPSWMPVEMSRHHVLGSHLSLLASGLEGKLIIKCKKTTWKAYVIGFIALMVTCTPNWILDVNLDYLKMIASGLRRWHEHELALALLERGGPAAVGAAAEHAMGYT